MLDGAVAVFDARRREWNRRASPCGGRPTGTACPGSRSSTRWTGRAPTSTPPSPPSGERLHPAPLVVQLPIGAEDGFTGVVDLLRACARLVWADGADGAEEAPVPDALRRGGARRRRLLEEAVAELPPGARWRSSATGDDAHRGHAAPTPCAT